MTRNVSPVPAGYQTITPQLTLDNAAQTIDWYKRALGAREVSRGLAPDGRIMHAEITIGTSSFFVNDVMNGGKGPKALGGSPAALWLYVEKSDELFNRAVDEGAKVRVPMDDQFWGDRAGAVADPAGYTWWIASRREDLSQAEIQQRAAAFFTQMATAGSR